MIPQVHHGCMVDERCAMRRVPKEGDRPMTDPYAPSDGSRADPGPTPTDLLSLFDGSAGAGVAAWPGDWNGYAAWLFSLCLRRRVPASDAQDVVQEVLSALGNFRRFRRDHPGAPLRPWMVGVLAKKISDLGRDRARCPGAIPVEILDALPGSRPLHPSSAPGGGWESSHYAPIFERVRRRCAEPDTWRVFQGIVLEGKTAAEVAAELEMDTARVHTAKSRVLRWLRQEIGAEAAPLQHEFDERTWSLFLEAGAEGTAPEVVARRRGLEEPEVHRAVARVLGRLRESLRDRAALRDARRYDAGKNLT
jgi:RNA polymerase sigma-70 factor (ECF subfamily)